MWESLQWHPTQGVAAIHNLAVCWHICALDKERDSDAHPAYSDVDQLWQDSLDGSMLISPVADTEAMRQMGFSLEAGENVGGFNAKQCQYLEYHRNEVLKKAIRSGL